MTPFGDVLENQVSQTVFASGSELALTIRECEFISSERAEQKWLTVTEPQFNAITSCLWDLRAHCEQQLRHLTEAQKCADEYRASPGSRYHAKNRIVGDLQNIVRLTVTIRAFANECSGMAKDLPIEDSAP